MRQRETDIRPLELDMLGEYNNFKNKTRDEEATGVKPNNLCKSSLNFAWKVYGSVQKYLCKKDIMRFVLSKGEMAEKL